MSPLSSPDDERPEAPPDAAAPTESEPPFDERRSPIIESLTEKLGDALLATELLPGRDLWARVRLDAWADVARTLRDDFGFTYFCYLSAVDWLPSPFGKSEDDSAPTVVDPSAPLEHGVTGGETRFQLLARLEIPGSGIGITLKTDIGDDLVAPTWIDTFAGANWHERETWEMFGISFAGHPYLVNLYLPGAFEGNPLRKDFPLLSRMVKPWPGLVDVEPMPGEDPEDADAEVSE